MQADEAAIDERAQQKARVVPAAAERRVLGLHRAEVERRDDVAHSSRQVPFRHAQLYAAMHDVELIGRLALEARLRVSLRSLAIRETARRRLEHDSLRSHPSLGCHSI